MSQSDTADAKSNSESGTAEDAETAEHDEPQDEHDDEPEKKLDGQALLAQMGGFTGLIYSSLPVLAFVPVNTYFGLTPAICAALGVATVILVWRLIRRDSLQPAISGYFGVGVSALVAWWLGEAKGFFLIGIWQSLIYAGGLRSLRARPPTSGRVPVELAQWTRQRVARGPSRRLRLRPRHDRVGAGVRRSVHRSALPVRRQRGRLARAWPGSPWAIRYSPWPHWQRSSRSARHSARWKNRSWQDDAEAGSRPDAA